MLAACCTLFPLSCIPLRSSLLIYISTPSGTPGGCHLCIGVGKMPKAYRCLGACRSQLIAIRQNATWVPACLGPCTAEIVTRSQNAYVISCIHCQIEHLPRLAGYSFLAPASALDPLDAQHVLVRAFLGRFAVHADASLCEKLRPSSIVVLCSERSRNA